MKYLVCSVILLSISCSNNDNAIRIKGSDTEVNLAVNLAEKLS